MLCIYSTNNDIYFNLAAEEYLLRNLQEDVFMLWKNKPAVVVGKHQNTFREVNYLYARANDIKIARRLSGGGTVFHDEGNLNFSFIRNGEEGKLIDFRKFTDPVRKALATFGLETRFEGNNSLTLNGYKVSGNAEHVFKSRVLHHGTLLFSTEMQALGEVLKVDQDTYEDRAVKSVRSKVANIQDFLDKPINIEEFTKNMQRFFSAELSSCKMYHFSENEQNAINELVKNKYRTSNWIFGWSPRYFFRKRFTVGDRELNVWLRVEKGIIKEAHVSGGPFNEKSLENLSYALKDKPHIDETIADQLSVLLAKINEPDVSPEKLMEAFF